MYVFTFTENREETITLEKAIWIHLHPYALVGQAKVICGNWQTDLITTDKIQVGYAQS